MATLENKLVKNTYKDILQVSNSNAGVDGTLRNVEDGEGTSSVLQISTAAVKSTGTFEVTGNSTLTGSATIGTTLGVTGATTLQGLIIGNRGDAQSTVCGANASLNQTGTLYTSAFGKYALYSLVSGQRNDAFGYTSLMDCTTGTHNACYGMQSGTGITTGTYNTIIGNSAGYNLTTGSNNTIIGRDATSSSASVSNEITLGNSSIATIRAQVTSITALSDRRDKSEIKNISEGIEFVKKLNPVSFTWNTRDGAKIGIKASGFIAQELLELQNNSEIGENLDLVSSNNPDKLEARIGNLIPVLVKAIQELQSQIDELKKGK